MGVGCWVWRECEIDLGVFLLGGVIVGFWGLWGGLSDGLGMVVVV